MGLTKNHEILRVGHEHTSTTFTADMHPALTVDQGEPFRVDTRSILSLDGFEETDEYERFAIPVTGPVAIRGVKPGDLLQVDIHQLEIANRGAMVTLPGRGGFTEDLGRYGRVVEIHGGQVHFDENITIPTRPMIGKLGVAPIDENANSSTVGVHGGNMDCKDIVAGASVLFPVQVRDGMLFAGDLHAVQGDGECSLTAVEVEGSIVMSCRVLGTAPLPRPVILSEGRVITMGDGDDLDEAARLALDDMLTLVQIDRGWTREKSAMLLSAAADVSVAQLVNPRPSMKVALEAGYFAAPPFPCTP